MVKPYIASTTLSGYTSGTTHVNHGTEKPENGRSGLMLSVLAEDSII